MFVGSWFLVWAKVTDYSMDRVQGPFETERGTQTQRDQREGERMWVWTISSPDGNLGVKELS